MNSQDDSINIQRITPRRQESVPIVSENEQLIFLSDSYSISKASHGISEDASFITDIGVGVSDGVGSWTSYGIDCSLFSGTLMKECQKLI